jgi:DNA-binding MurR/RpiR family transcriptional regulator
MAGKKNKTVMEQMQDPSSFTEIEQNVIHYILDHQEEVTTMNIGDLSKAAYTSNGTIIRICRKLGCDGFRQLKHELTKDLEASRYLQKEVDFNTPFGTHQSVPDIIDSLSDLYRESVTITQHSLDQSRIREAAQRMSHAKRIFIFAVGDSMITAEAFANKLVKIGMYAILPTSHSDEVSFLPGIQKDDAALFVSYSGENPRNVIDTLKQKQIPLIGITANENSKVAKCSDILILIPNKEAATQEKIATYYSQVSFSLVLNIIYALMYALHQ